MTEPMNPSQLPRAAGLVALAVLALASGCGTTGAYVWVDVVPRTMLAADTTSEIHPGDVIGIRVFNQEANSVDRARVRDDGRISVPLLNDVEVAGLQPGDLAKRLEAKLKTFIVSPVVTVVVHERRPVRVSVLGQVTRPGVYDLDGASGLLHALAAAGGPTPFAKKDGIYVLRSAAAADDQAPGRIRFRSDDLRTGRPPAALFRMRAGDVVVVE
jgi:polysaccharide export outer membrane protein